MADKYKTLVDIILHAHPDSRVIEDTKKVITIGESSCGETYFYTYYIIKEHGNYVKIEMKANHPTWGAPETYRRESTEKVEKRDFRAVGNGKLWLTPCKLACERSLETGPNIVASVGDGRSW